MSDLVQVYVTESSNTPPSVVVGVEQETSAEPTVVEVRESGQRGVKGDDGKSSYEVWLDAGNTGTVQDYLDSLQANVDIDTNIALGSSDTSVPSQKAVKTYVDNVAATKASTTSVSNEISRATSAEAALTTSISSIDYALAVETNRATAEEQNLYQIAADNDQRALDAEQALALSITGEAQRAVAAETSLSQAISAEATRADAVETSLSAAIDTETTRATAAEAALEVTPTTLATLTSGAMNILDNWEDGGHSIIVAPSDGGPTLRGYFSGLLTWLASTFAKLTGDQSLTGAASQLRLAIGEYIYLFFNNGVGEVAVIDTEYMQLRGLEGNASVDWTLRTLNSPVDGSVIVSWDDQFAVNLRADFMAGVMVADGHKCEFGSFGSVSMTADGVASLLDTNNTGFVGLHLGPSTSVFPYIKRNGSGISIRNGDDTSAGAVACAGVTSSGNVLADGYLEIDKVSPGNQVIYIGPIPGSGGYSGFWARARSAATGANYAFLSDGAYTFFNSTADTYFRIGNANKMTIRGSNGFVGIGNITPTEALHVTGNSIVSGSAAAGSVVINTANTADKINVGGLITTYGNGNGFAMYNLGANYTGNFEMARFMPVGTVYTFQALAGGTGVYRAIKFVTNNGSFFLDPTTGFMGVGQDVPTAKLDVNGTFNAAGNFTGAGPVNTLNNQTASALGSIITLALLEQLGGGPYSRMPIQTTGGWASVVTGTGLLDAQTPIGVAIRAAAYNGTGAATIYPHSGSPYWQIGSFGGNGYGGIDFSKEIILTFAVASPYCFDATKQDWGIILTDQMQVAGTTGMFVSSASNYFGVKCLAGSVYLQAMKTGGTVQTTTALDTFPTGCNCKNYRVVSNGAGTVSLYSGITLLGSITGGPVIQAATNYDKLFITSASSAATGAAQNQYLNFFNLELRWR